MDEHYQVEQHHLRVSERMSIFYRDYKPVADIGRTPLIYLPGFLRTARDFDRVASRLATERRVVTVDTRGRGRGGRSNAVADYHFDRLIDDLWQLADHLKIQRMVVAGLTLGTFMAWRMAASQPNRVIGIIANDTGTETSPAAGKSIIATAVSEESNFDDTVARLRKARASDFPDFGPAEWREYALQAFARGSRGGWIRDFDPLVLDEFARFGVETPNLWDDFVTLRRTPILILRGEHSTYLQQEHAERMVAAVESASLVTVQTRGHPPLLDEPASLGAIRRLLAECDG
jgi:pimeloyl-ACP methyl ester carboxylesterase